MGTFDEHSCKIPSIGYIAMRGGINVSDLSADAVKARIARLAKLMAENDQLSGFLRRVAQRRQELGLSERKAAVVARLSPSQIRTMRRQMREGKQRGVSIRTIDGLAQALQTTPEWLILGTGQKELTKEAVPENHQPSEAIVGLRLAGAVGAGLWQEAASENNETQLAPASPDPRFPAECQSAYEVRGTSMDTLARSGDYLIVLDRKAAGIPLRSGDVVMVTQTKNGLRETTARRFRTRTTAPGCELTFESSDPKHNVGIWLPNEESNEPISLGGIVVGVYRPLP
jgi:transcriptional regulator with XRE-family HTH domain